MSIFVDRDTKVVYQGLTGSQGRFYGRQVHTVRQRVDRVRQIHPCSIPTVSSILAELLDVFDTCCAQRLRSHPDRGL